MRRSAWLAATCAVLSAASAGGAIAAIRHLDAAAPSYLRVVDDANRPYAAQLVTDVHSHLVVHAVIGVAGLVVFAPLSLAIRRPRRIARVAAWTGSVLLATGLAYIVATGPEALVLPTGMETRDVRVALDNLLAGWYPALTGTLAITVLVAGFTLSLLLLRTSAADFYDRPRGPGLLPAVDPGVPLGSDLADLTGPGPGPA